MPVSTMTPTAARRRPATGLPYLVASGLLWGTGGLTGALLSRAAGLPAMSVAAYRLAVGGTLIVVYLAAARRRRPAGRAAWTRIAVVGLLAALFQASYFAAVSLTTVSVATLVTIGSAPVIVLVVEAVTGRRRIGPRVSGAAVLALAGLALLIGLPQQRMPEAAMLGGAGLAVLAASGFATMTLVGARPVPGLDDLTVTGLGFTAGGLALLPLAAAAGPIGFPADPATLGLLIALGLGPTALAYTLYFRGLRAAPASTAALLTLLEPLTSAVLSALILGDRLGPAGVAGAVILSAAVVLTVRTSQ